MATATTIGLEDVILSSAAEEVADKDDGMKKDHAQKEWSAAEHLKQQQKRRTSMLQMQQQHSLDSSFCKLEIEMEKQQRPADHNHKTSMAATIPAGAGIRRTSTTPAAAGGRKKSTMVAGYKYAPRPTESATVFSVPPVFPKTCSLFDATFNGGAFSTDEEDQKLMEALGKVRDRGQHWHKCTGTAAAADSGSGGNGSRGEAQHQQHHQQQHQQQQTLRTHSQIVDDSANLSDSGHSSITTEEEGGTSASSPPLSHFSFFTDSISSSKTPPPPSSDGLHISKDSVFFTSSIDEKHNNDENEEGAGWKKPKNKKKSSDFGLLNIRKNSRILFFRQRAKSCNKKADREKGGGAEADEQHQQQPWTIDGSKGLSWKCKLLRTLSTGGGVHLAGAGEEEQQRRQKGEKPSDHFGKLDREWEVVTVRELCRRLSLEDSLEPSEMPLPEGALHSQVLDEFMIRQILDILPPRAEGYPWVNIYNSEKHGFSLSTLYRKMSEWKEEMSPVLLVLRDVAGHVFGAVTSTALRPCDHYYGTGDSCLLFRFTGEYPHTRELRTYNWTGNNQFFVNATRDFLSVGAGGGHYGLWLDADLNNGRSQKCATFDNEPLAGGLDEDFTIQFVEAWGFCMT